MEVNALNINTAGKQLWLYFIQRTTQLAYTYMGTTTNFTLFWITKKTNIRKNSCQIFLPPKHPESKNSNPKTTFDYPCHLKYRVPLWQRHTQLWVCICVLLIHTWIFGKIIAMEPLCSLLKFWTVPCKLKKYFSYGLHPHHPVQMPSVT